MAHAYENNLVERGEPTLNGLYVHRETLVTAKQQLKLHTNIVILNRKKKAFYN